MTFDSYADAVEWVTLGLVQAGEPVASRTYVNHWDDYGGVDPRFACHKETEFCSNCGRQMVESIEPTGLRLRSTGERAMARYHSCPTWTDRSFLHRLRSFGTPGMGHDSHDADNPLSVRDYR